jgi:hypothetical protein
VSEIACTLGDEARRDRARELRAGLFREVASRRTTDDGIEVRFPKTDALMRQLADYIAFESGCCAFLRFDLIVESRSDLVTLRLSGPGGTRAFVEGWLEVPEVGAR